MLESFLPHNQSAIDAATDIDLGVIFWEASLTPDQVNELVATKMVDQSTLLLNDTNLFGGTSSPEAHI